MIHKMAGDIMCLENLEEFVFDEDKVVTYRWLSQTLSLHVNQAKQLLETFVQRQRKDANSQSVTVTYLLSGVQKADNGVNVNKVVVVADKDLEKTEAAMMRVLSKHVYSVQKAALKDSNSLYATDYQIIKDNMGQPNKFSAIQCAEAKPRSPEELGDLGEQSAYPTSDTSGQRQPKMNGSADKHVIESLKPDPQRGAGGKSKKGQITSFGGFAAGSSKSSTNKSARKEETGPNRVPKEEPKQPRGKPKGGMMAFLNRPSTAKVKKEDKSPPRETPMTTTTTTTTTHRSQIVATTSAEHDKAQGTKKSLKTGGKAKRKAAKINVSDSDSGEEKQVTKRRRRIIQQDASSSSSEDEVSDMEDSPIPPTPPPALVDTNDSDNEGSVTNGSPRATRPGRTEPTQTSPSSGKRRRKKRVLRNKVTVDDDGCMVTEKVYESDWTDVSEDEAPPTKKTTPAPSKEGGAKTGGVMEEEKGKKKNKTSPGSSTAKQRSLMSFFKKK